MNGEYDRETLELLIDLDERGRRLTEVEIEFVAALIDGDVRTFTVGQAARIRSLHRHRVVDDDDDCEGD